MAKDEKKYSIPTIVDVARESGVSYSTVSRVLNGYEFVRTSTREKVLHAAEKLGYVPNRQARSLAGGRSNVIGILVPGLDNGYIGEIVRGIDEDLAKSNYDLMLYTTHRHEGKESRYVTSITNGLTDGLILVVPLIPTAYVEALRQRNFPYVLIDQSDMSDKSSIVDATNWQGAYDGTRYLIQLGHRRIGFITGLLDLASAVDRLEGYKAALSDHDLPLQPEWVVEADFWQAGGYQAAQALLALPQRPTAIFASNDLSAFGAMEAIRDCGLRIPEDLSIIGFDDIPQAAIAYPKLTTIRQPLAQMGRVAAQMLVEHIENPDRPARRVTLATQVVIRDSCQPPR
ncbi:MAG: LacI family transcriptional regulator [Anaerolineae bacterium]|nr:LacI family transcriptional regulator [Anaerolineae bacterium]